MNEREPRDDHLGRQVSLTIKRTRRAIGWSQRELASRLKRSQSVIQRLESGTSAYLDVRLASAAFHLLGVTAVFDARTLGLAIRGEQRDLVHAWCVAYVSRRLQRQGWQVRTEVEIGDGRYRGWIDLLACRPSDGALICGEIKTQIDDVGRIQRTIGWYARESIGAARRLGWQPRSTTAVLFVLCSTDNDRAITLNRELLRSAFPGSARDLAAWSLTPGGRLVASLAMIDPGSRRPDWLRPTTSEGRRSPAPYATYRAAAEAIRATMSIRRDPARGSASARTRSAAPKPSAT